jgi:hypothetical protein
MNGSEGNSENISHWRVYSESVWPQVEGRMGCGLASGDFLVWLARPIWLDGLL